MSDDQKEYPYESGDTTVIGPECFASESGSIISWRGENYYLACGQTVTESDDGSSSTCVKRVGHPGIRHEDYVGNTYDSLNGLTPETIEIPIPQVGVMDDGTPIHINKLDVRLAWEGFVAPVQSAKMEMTDELRTVAALLRAVNEGLPSVFDAHKSVEFP